AGMPVAEGDQRDPHRRTPGKRREAEDPSHDGAYPARHLHPASGRDVLRRGGLRLQRPGDLRGGGANRARGRGREEGDARRRGGADPCGHQLSLPRGRPPTDDPLQRLRPTGVSCGEPRRPARIVTIRDRPRIRLTPHGGPKMKTRIPLPALLGLLCLGACDCAATGASEGQLSVLSFEVVDADPPGDARGESLVVVPGTQITLAWTLEAEAERVVLSANDEVLGEWGPGEDPGSFVDECGPARCTTAEPGQVLYTLSAFF